jgi:hypothetical protein
MVSAPRHAEYTIGDYVRLERYSSVMDEPFRNPLA